MTSYLENICIQNKSAAILHKGVSFPYVKKINISTDVVLMSSVFEKSFAPVQVSPEFKYPVASDPILVGYEKIVSWKNVAACAATFSAAFIGMQDAPKVALATLPTLRSYVYPLPLNLHEISQEVREYIKSTGLLSIDDLGLVYDHLKADFGDVCINSNLYEDIEEGWKKIILTVNSGISNFEEQWQKEKAFFHKAKNNPSLKSALTQIIIDWK